MDTREQLQACEKLRRILAELEQKAEEIENNLYYSSVTPRAERVQETKQNGEEIKRILLINTKTQIKKQAEELDRTQANNLKVISNIEDTKQKALLVIKYILCTTNEQAAEIMNCDKRHFYRIREKAIQAAEMAYKAKTARSVKG